MKRRGRSLVLVALLLLVLTACSQPREAGVGAKIRESQGKQANTYTAIVDSYIKSLAELKSKADKDAAGSAFQLLGMVKGVELRFEGDKTAQARQIVDIFKQAGKEAAPGNIGGVLDRAISDLEKLKR